MSYFEGRQNWSDIPHATDLAASHLQPSNLQKHQSCLWRFLPSQSSQWITFDLLGSIGVLPHDGFGGKCGELT